MPQRRTTKKSDSDGSRPVLTHRDLTEITRRLAELLIEAAPLATLLNLPTVAHKYRTELRHQVGVEQYFGLANTLHQMCSMRGWQMAHAKDTAELERLQPPSPVVTYDGTSVRIHRRGH